MMLRRNPENAWWAAPEYLKNDPDGYIVNPDTDSNIWFHGDSGQNELFRFRKESSTLYMTSAFESASEFACEKLDPDDEDDQVIVWKLMIHLPTSRILDVRRALHDHGFREILIRELQGSRLADALEEFEDHAEDVSNLPRFRRRVLDYTTYDHQMNSYFADALRRLGYVGWVEFEGGSFPAPVSVAILYDDALDCVEIVDAIRLSMEDCDGCRA